MREFPRWVFSKHDSKIVNSHEEFEALGEGWDFHPHPEGPRSHPHDPIGKFLDEHHHHHHPIEDDEISKEERHHKAMHQHLVFHPVIKDAKGKPQRGRPAGSKRAAKKGEED